MIKQQLLEQAQYQQLQKTASLTEVEIFSEPYENWYVFSIEKEQYATFMDYLDRTGIAYDLTANRPSRDELLAGMR